MCIDVLMSAVSLALCEDVPSRLRATSTDHLGLRDTRKLIECVGGCSSQRMRAFDDRWGLF